ncbi:MAG: YkgJ family cysteine cluster protein [Methanocella sp.]
MDDSLSIERLCADCHPDKCCTRFLRVSREDVDRWKAEGRGYILAHIRERLFEGKTIYEVRSPGKGCIFLKDGWCSIHETKPIVCRNFLCLRAMELKALNNW